MPSAACKNTHSGITNTVNWNLGTINAGGAPSGSLRVKGDSGRSTDLSHTTSPSTTTTDTLPLHDALPISTQVKTQADIYVTKSDSPDPVLAGNNLTYTLGVHNGRPAEHTSELQSPDHPACTRFLSATGGGTYSGITNTVTWNLGTITAGGAPSVSLVVKVDSGRTTDLSNTASASTTSTDNDLTNNAPTDFPTRRSSDLIYVTKSDSPDPVLAGNNLTYTLGVHNGGPSDALGVVLSHPTPYGMIW